MAAHSEVQDKLDVGRNISKIQRPTQHSQILSANSYTACLFNFEKKVTGYITDRVILHVFLFL